MKSEWGGIYFSVGIDWAFDEGLDFEDDEVVLPASEVEVSTFLIIFHVNSTSSSFRNNSYKSLYLPSSSVS